MRSTTILEGYFVAEASNSHDFISHDFLSREEVANLTPAVLIERIESLSPLISDCAAEAERLRRPVDKVWRALRQSGYFYQFVPRRFGGMATDLESFIDATLPIAEACASTAWTASFGAAHNRNLANFPESTQREIWGGDFPYVIAPQVAHSVGEIKIEVVDGGLRVGGTWDWATGIMHADWIMAICSMKQQDSPPQIKLVLFPSDEARVDDVWFTDGMSGTGSNNISVQDLFIPNSRVLSDINIFSGNGLASRIYPEDVYRVPMFSFGQVISSVVALGAARRVVKLYRDSLQQGNAASSRSSGLPHQLAQARLAKADVMVRTAELIMRHNARSAGKLGRLPIEEQLPARIAFRTDYTFAVGLCRKAALLLSEFAGASMHLLHQPFQRAVRDLVVLASHVAFNADLSYELQGGAMLGTHPQMGQF